MDPSVTPEILDFLSKYSLFGIPALALVVALVAIAKLFGLPSRWAPVASLVAGGIVSGAIALINFVPPAEPWVRYIALSLLLGLAGVGIHAAIKTVIGRFQFVPPGTAIKTPKGVHDVTPTSTFTEGKVGPKPQGTV